MWNVSHKRCRENQNTFYVQYVFSENSAVCKPMCKNSVQLDRPQMTVRRMRIACWIPKATDTHTENIACLLQQWLQERASTLRYTYVACLVNVKPDDTEVTVWLWNVDVMNMVIWCVPFNFKPFWFTSSLSMAYSKEKLKSNGHRASPCFSLFLVNAQI